MFFSLFNLIRPTAKEALNHPWFTEAKYKDGL